MIDETKIIKKLQTRIDEFIKTHPEKKDCESVQTIREFINLLEIEAKEQEEMIRKIAQHYGYDAQSRQCIEEMAELTQAINKYWRQGLQCGQVQYPDHNGYMPMTSCTYDNLVEEIVDVQIMLWQLEYLLNADVEPIIEQKISRQLER